MDSNRFSVRFGSPFKKVLTGLVRSDQNPKYSVRPEDDDDDDDDSNTDTVDSNRMFKKHNPRRMMMNGFGDRGPQTRDRVSEPETPKNTVAGKALAAQRRLTKSLMNDASAGVSSSSWPSSSGFGNRPSQLLRWLRFHICTKNSKMPPTLAEVEGWRSERNFHLRFILMMLSDCAENVGLYPKLHTTLKENRGISFM